MLLNGNFEFGEDGFFLSPNGKDVNPTTKSDTNSMNAEISSNPDGTSLPMYDSWEENDHAVETTLEKPMDSILASDILFGSGDWQDSTVYDDSEILLFPWRVELPSHAEIHSDLCAKQPSSDNKRNHPEPLIIRTSSLHSSGSCPGLTESSSRYSESIIPPDYVPIYEEEMVSEVFPSSHESNELLSNFCFDQKGSAILGNPASNGDNNILETAQITPYVKSLSPEHQGQNSVDSDSIHYSEISHLDEIDSDTESVWMSDYSEGIPTLEEAHPFLRIKNTAVRDALLEFEKWPLQHRTDFQQSPQDAADETNNSGRNAQSTPNNSETRRQASSSFTRKRRTTKGNDENQGDEENDDDENRRQGKRTRLTKKSMGHQVCLACPFAKKDPITHRRCYSFILRRTQDVKQHLSRYHQLPIYCPRCKEIFTTESERDNHAERAETSCEARQISYEGVTREQKEQLTQRVSARMTLEDQWYTIFDILFPGHIRRPSSPYIDNSLSLDLEAFMDMMAAQGPAIILASLQAHGILLSSINNEEHDLSTMLQIVIAQGLEDIAQRWMAITNTGSQSNHHVDGSVASEGFGTIPSSESSRTSSETLVESRARPITMSLYEERPDGLPSAPSLAQPPMTQFAEISTRLLSAGSMNPQSTNTNTTNVLEPHEISQPSFTNDTLDSTVTETSARNGPSEGISLHPIDHLGTNEMSSNVRTDTSMKLYDEYFRIPEEDGNLWE